MKTVMIAAGFVGFAFLFSTLAGCETASPGVRDYAGTYTTMIDGAPDKVTDSARKSLEEMKLRDIVANGTKIDGKVTARTAQNVEVTIEISQGGENISKVAVRVGVTGDEAVSNQILDKVKANMHRF